MLRAHTRSRGLVAAAGGPSLWDYSLTAGTLPPVLSVARGTTATRVNASGLIVVEAANVPRWNYDPITLAGRGLLIEPQKTNLVAYSEDLAQSVYTTTNSAKIANAGTSPANGIAQGFQQNTTNGNHDLSISSGLSGIADNATMRLSFFAARGAGYSAEISGAARRKDGSFPSHIRDFDTLEQLSITPGLIGYIEQYQNGWVRIIADIPVLSGATTLQARMRMTQAANSAVQSFTGDGIGILAIWGVEVMDSPTLPPTSYVPTTGSAATRDADVVTLLDTSRASEITYVPLGSSTPTTCTVAAGAQPPSTLYGHWTRVRQL